MQAARGIGAMVAACTIWGLSPLYYKLIAHVPPLEVLSHRTLWSLVFFGAVLLIQKRLPEVWVLIGNWRALVLVAFAAIMISANWFLYILSIQVGRTVEASLGYYMFPLVAVILGLLAFSESLSPIKWLSVGLAVVAVLVLTIGLGATPGISMALATTFGLYGLAKKCTRAGPVASVTAEVLVLAPLAVIWLAGVHQAGWSGLTGRSGGVFGHDLGDSLILVLSGPLTAGPLILLSYASRRITMATLGLVQYLNPTLQFLCAVVVFQEPFTGWHGLAFGLIWLALALYSAEVLRQDKALRKASAKVSISVTGVI
ncbi:MAG: EamA family transporter RarD [Paracoccaceae bacterium]